MRNNARRIWGFCLGVSADFFKYAAELRYYKPDHF